MKTIIIDQLIYETETWKRLIVFVKNENLLRINRLSEIIKSTIDKAILFRIEDFQEQFLKLEDIYLVLNNEVVNQKMRLVLFKKEAVENDFFQLIKFQKEIRITIETLIAKTNRLKADFFQNLSEELFLSSLHF